MVTRVTVTIFLVCDKVFPAVLDDDASGGSTDLATQQVITDSVCWAAGLGSRDGRMRVQILNGEAKTAGNTLSHTKKMVTVTRVTM